MKKKLFNEKGSAAIILCAAITAIFAFTAYVVDIGFVYIERTRLSNALDAAVLAALLELPANDQSARQVAADYLQKNNVNSSDAVITISSDKETMEIDGQRVVKHLFAGVFGIKTSTVKSETKGIVAPLKSVYGGIRPFAVELFNYTYGNRVVLKNGAGSGYNGNYNAISLGGTGASNFEKNALYGYSGTISIGDYINTETGDMSGACNDIKNYINSEVSTFNNFPRGSIRLWTIPLVNTMMVNGKKEVLVQGFGQFYVEDVNKNAGKIEVTGRFIRYVTKGEIDLNAVDRGTYGVKLVR